MEHAPKKQSSAFAWWKFILLLLPFAFLLLSSCVREVKNIVLPSQEPQLVISCFIAPQQKYLSATITLSQPLYALSDPNQSNLVSNALVVISDGQNSQTLTYGKDPATGDSLYLYQFDAASQLHILPGQTYTIQVSTPDGKSASASTSVPMHDNESAVPVIDSLPPSNGYRNFKIDVEWQDSAGTVDYYRVQYQVFDPDLGPTRPELTRSFPVVSDQGNDGGTLFVRNGNQTRSAQNVSQKTLKLSMSVIDVNYYKYYTSLASYSDDNPFAEPTLVYTNVSGGLGIFASYMEYVKSSEF